MVQGSLFTPETQSQESAILNHLLSGRSINPLEALDLYKCFRLGARIFSIKQAVRKQGHNIEREMITVQSGKRVASYRLKRVIG